MRARSCPFLSCLRQPEDDTDVEAANDAEGDSAIKQLEDLKSKSTRTRPCLSVLRSYRVVLTYRYDFQTPYHGGEVGLRPVCGDITELVFPTSGPFVVCIVCFHRSDACPTAWCLGRCCHWPGVREP